jgi:hypothetical protein
MTFQDLKKLAENRKGVEVRFDHENFVALVNGTPFDNLIFASKFVKENFELTEKFRAEREAENKVALKRAKKTSDALLFGLTD